MRAPADITVYDENDQICALVEVKAVPESTPEWAIRRRREVIEEGRVTPRFFLVVTRDFAYIWTSAASPEAETDEIVPTDELFQKYLRDIQSNAQSIAPSSLELMVGIWLTDLAQQVESAVQTKIIEHSGLSSAIANGRVEFLAAA